jgi:gliding motility-associated lipoprotein GldH
MKKFGLFLLSMILLVSCNSKKIFENYQDIENMKWSRDKVVTFEVDIEDTSTPFNVELAIRHTSYYVWANLKVNLTTIYPSGEERTRDYDFFLRNEDGSFKAEGAGDLWDISFPLLDKINFSETGKYIFKIQNIMPQPETDDIMQVGLVVKKNTN